MNRLLCHSPQSESAGPPVAAPEQVPSRRDALAEPVIENSSLASVAVPWTITLGLTLAVLMDALNGTIFTIARPQIMGAAAATPDEVSWINLGYLMAKVACLPAAAWLVGRYGETRSFLWSAALVVATSILCALPVDLPFFVGTRIAQGAAGAVLLVAAQSILFQLFPSARQGLVQALYALGVVMAPTSLAPAIQGWFTDDFSWTWNFWLTPALASVAFLCLAPVLSYMPNTRHTECPFDRIGFGLFSLSMASLVYVLLEGPRWNWFDDTHITVLATIGCGALVATLGWWGAGPRKSEMFDSSVFKNPQFSFGFLVSFVAGFALFGSAFLIPVFALNVLAMPAMVAGLLLLPSSLAVGGGLLIAGLLITVWNFAPLKLVPFGIVLVMVAMWMLSWSNSDSGDQDLWLGLLLRGFGLGFLFLAVTLITLNRLKSDHVASGIGLFNFGRQMGGIIGISFLNTYLNHQVALNRRILIENINPANPAFQQRQAVLVDFLQARGLDPSLAQESAAAEIRTTLQAQVAALSFNDGFLSLMILFIVAVPFILLFKVMQKGTGWSH